MCTSLFSLPQNCQGLSVEQENVESALPSEYTLICSFCVYGVGMGTEVDTLLLKKMAANLIQNGTGTSLHFLFLPLEHSFIIFSQSNLRPFCLARELKLIIFYSVQLNICILFASELLLGISNIMGLCLDVMLIIGFILIRWTKV